MPAPPPTDAPEAPPRAVIAALQTPDIGDADHAATLAELRRLLETLGYEVVGVVTQRRARPHPGVVFGEGKLRELAAYTGGRGTLPTPGHRRANKRDEEPEDEDSEDEVWSHAADLPPITLPDDAPRADTVVVDHEISPRQARNLELITDAAVLDRTGVIVEIFHRHAHTREARLQVEIARLTYVAPRLRASAGRGDRQRGGIGGKGAGESALELDRRKIRDRIAALRAELAAIDREEDLRRARRSDQLRVALVGYTNAGKSSLMRALTVSGVLVEDKLFATLGTTVRALDPPIGGPRILVSDTVGFIQRLPHDLVASFRSTLDEAREASLRLHVVDASDPGFRNQLAVTREVLAEIGAADLPTRLVLNKIDRVDAFRRRSLAQEFPDALHLSALDPDDIARLHAEIARHFVGESVEAELHVPHRSGAILSEMHQHGQVLAEVWDESGALVRVRASESALARWRAQLTLTG